MEKNLREAYRIWVREVTKESLGDDYEKTGWMNLPVKEFTEIAILEVHDYLMKKQWPSPVKTTAEILGIHRDTVLCAIKKHS